MEQTTDLLWQIQRINDKLETIYKRRIPYQNMKRGKAAKRGNAAEVASCDREIARLRSLIERALAKREALVMQLDGDAPDA